MLKWSEARSKHEEAHNLKEQAEQRLKMSRDSILEIQHKREQSQDSGTYQDWAGEDTTGGMAGKGGEFVTVVTVDEKPFVTVLSVDSSPPESEEVLVYRLPGERLGFGLKFDGGVKSAEKVKKLLIQSCAEDSPASRTRASWGPLSPGDEILVIDSVPVSEMTRMDCVRALKESNVVIKLRVRKSTGLREEDKEAPPIPPRKFPRKKELASSDPVFNYDEVKKSPPILPRSRQIPQAEFYTDLLSQECILPTESESDDTGSSISTVVSRISSTPTTCNSSFSDGKSINSIDFQSPSPEGKQTAYDLDKVLEPFLHLEREFSTASINENHIFHKLVEASNLIESSSSHHQEESEAPKPAPRQEKRRPPPPPPPPRTDRQPTSGSNGCQEPKAHLPRLIDFVPKDRTDVVVPSPLVPQQPPPPPPTKPPEESIPEDDIKTSVKEEADGAPEEMNPSMDGKQCYHKNNGLLLRDPFPPMSPRLPPDGHEFEHPSDKPLIKHILENEKISASPHTKEVKPKSNIESKKYSTETSKYSWRNDEKSEKSVKDKIAMFSNVQNNTPLKQPLVVARKLSGSLSTSDRESVELFTDAFIKDKCDNLSPKDHYKKETVFPSMQEINSDFEMKPIFPNNEKTLSSFDLSDDLYKSEFNKEFSTLPRKSEQGLNSITANGGSSLSRAFSFSGESRLHNRSQSMIDVGARNLSLQKQEELRRSSLAALTEQRKKTYSKLRGLVIPEKVNEVPSLVVDDLPVIKSTDCLLEEKLDEEKLSLKLDVEKQGVCKPNEKTTTMMPSQLWKNESSYEIPKYSPAFKRKSLSLYGVSSTVSSVSSSLSSSREELRTCFSDTSAKSIQPIANGNITKTLANLSRHPFSNQSEPKSLESITSPSISDLSYEYPHESVSPNSNLSNTSNEVPSRFKYHEGYLSDSSKPKRGERGGEESDNDSAVSSSRSSISPPQSPISGAKKNGNPKQVKPLSSSSCGGVVHEVKLKRTLSSETTASNSSTGSTLTSGSQVSLDNLGENKRVLKPQSVEAINRKNVLSSARHSNGGTVLVDPKTDDVIPLDNKVSPTKTNLENTSKESEENTIAGFEKERASPKFDSKDPPSLESLSPLASLNSSSEGEQSKNVNHSHELIKGETSFNIEDFTYSKRSATDKKSKLKLSGEFGDQVDGGDSPPRWPINDYCPVGRHQKSLSQIEPPSKVYEKLKEDLPVPKSVSVNSMKKVFEKVDNGGLVNNRFKLNQGSYQHPRVSSVDSTNSDDSCVPNPSHYGSASNLLKEQQFGSITSLASSTSLISQQELSQLIEEANHTLEDEGNSHEVLVVILYRDNPGSSIGITLAGGADYEAKEITVHKVIMGSPADKDGRIQRGDRILSINGKSMKGLTHYESLAILKAPRPEVVLVVSRHRGDAPVEEGPSTSNTNRTAASARMSRYLESKATCQPIPPKGRDMKWGPPVTVTLIKDGTGLGFSLEGGKDSPNGDLPLTIKKIFTGGCAEKSGNLFAGDELLSVNNIDLGNRSRIDAWSLMKKLPDGEVALTVRHPFP